VSAATEQPGDAPGITVTRGAPTSDEIAAVVTVLVASRAAAAAAAPPARPRATSAWAEGSRLRAPLSTVGPNAWRAAALPR
jgi:hypothetical protein